MADIIVFGQVAVDIVVRVPTVPLQGEVVAGEGLGWRVGGSSANVACALSSAGHRVQLVGRIGADELSVELLRELERWGVGTDLITKQSRPSPRTVIMLDDSGERTMISLDPDPSLWRLRADQIPDLSAADCVVVESYERYPSAIAEASPQAMLVASPPSPGFARWPADVVVGSETQLPAGLREPFSYVAAVAGPRLLWVVATRGSLGAIAYSADASTTLDARPVDQVDATGAGDAFAAGLVHGLLTGDGVEAAMELGMRWGAEAVVRLQSLPPSWAEVMAAPQR